MNIINEDEKEVERLIGLTFSKVMTHMSRRAKLLALEGKAYNTVEYDIKDISKIFNDKKTINDFIKILINESEEDVIRFILYVMDMFYNLSDGSVNNKNVEKFIADSRFVIYRETIFGLVDDK